MYFHCQQYLQHFLGLAGLWQGKGVFKAQLPLFLHSLFVSESAWGSFKRDVEHLERPSKESTIFLLLFLGKITRCFKRPTASTVQVSSSSQKAESKMLKFYSNLAQALRAPLLSGSCQLFRCCGVLAC